jgi:protein gp37
MALSSAIEWTNSTWNPTTGCTKTSLGCKNCYAERMAIRLKAIGHKNYRNGFKLTLHEDMLILPLQWKKPQNIFVNSMSDLFHEDVPNSFIINAFNVMQQAHWHHFQILTKRSNRLRELSNSLIWAPNIWLGVSIENSNYVQRIEDLRSTGAQIKFLSIEPLLGPLVGLNLTDIDWVIVGGESGVGARPLQPSWVIDIKNQCQNTGIPFFFKQWGGKNKKKSGRLLEGRHWDEMPQLSETMDRVLNPSSRILINDSPPIL